MEPAGVYARISLDRAEGAGVKRQVADGVALAEERGWQVIGPFVDNDRSAYNGKPRPQWERLLAEVRAGTVKHVVGFASDRLYRRTRDQLDLMEAVAAAGGTIATAKDGEVNPASAEGRMRMTILSSVAEFESARKAERVARAAEQRAAKGRPHGRPPFGWKVDGAGEWTLDPDQAAMVREAAMRILRGESAFTICADWNEQGLATAAGADGWDHRALRKILRRDANAGLRVHRGRVVATATWPAILDMETHEAVVARLGAPGGQRRPRRYLLTGVIFCTADGERMAGHTRRVPGYQCRACGRRIGAERLDAYVTDRVLTKLDTPRLAQRLAHARSDAKEAGALRDLDRADARLEQLATMFGSGDLDVAEYRAARSAAQDRRADAQRRLSSRRSNRVLTEALASPDGVRDVWDGQAVPWRREVIAAVLERIEIGESTRSAWESERVRLVWRRS